MNKKLIIGLILFLLPFTGFSQIGQEIESFVDSTEILVQKGRRMIFKELSDSNMVKTKEIYDYLTEKTLDNPYAAFYYLEDIYINMLTGDWESVHNLMLDFEKLKNKNVYPNTQDLILKLRTLTLQRSQDILKDSESSQLDDQAKSLITLLIHYLETSSIDEYNRELTAYQKKYKNNKYESFEKGFMPNKIMKAAWGISLGSGMIFTTGDLTKSFSKNALFNMSMDFKVNKVLVALYIQGTNLKLREPFTAASELDTLNFTLNEKFTYLDAGLRAGYFIVRSNRFHVIPYASISGSYLESTRYADVDDNDLEYEIFNSFTYGVGIQTEVKVHEFKSRNYYYGGLTNGYLSVKLEAGYNKIAKFKDQYCIGDTPYINCGLVLGIGYF